MTTESNTTEHLLRSAEYLSECEAVRELDHPDWNDEGTFLDWKGYIPGEVQLCWKSLSLESRLVAMLRAQT